MKRLIALTALASGVLAAGCGSSTQHATSATTARTAVAFPATIAAANGNVIITARPTRILSLSATATEML